MGTRPQTHLLTTLLLVHAQPEMQAGSSASPSADSQEESWSSSSVERGRSPALAPPLTSCVSFWRSESSVRLFPEVSDEEVSGGKESAPRHLWLVLAHLWIVLLV